MAGRCTVNSSASFSDPPLPPPPPTQDVYETPEKIYLVQELCAGGSLIDYLMKHAPLTEERAASIFHDVLKSVLHCHEVR